MYLLLLLLQSKSEDCLKCMLKVPHKKCEGVSYKRNEPRHNNHFLSISKCFSAAKCVFVCV